MSLRRSCAEIRAEPVLRLRITIDRSQILAGAKSRPLLQRIRPRLGYILRSQELPFLLFPPPMRRQRLAVSRSSASLSVHQSSFFQATERNIGGILKILSGFSSLWGAWEFLTSHNTVRIPSAYIKCYRNTIDYGSEGSAFESRRLHFLTLQFTSVAKDLECSNYPGFHKK